MCGFEKAIKIYNFELSTEQDNIDLSTINFSKSASPLKLLLESYEHINMIYSICFSSCENYLVSGSIKTCKVICVNIADKVNFGKLLYTYNHIESVETVKFSPYDQVISDGYPLFVSGCLGNFLIVHKMQADLTFKVVINKTLKMSIRSVSFSPCARELVVGGTSNNANTSVVVIIIISLYAKHDSSLFTGEIIYELKDIINDCNLNHIEFIQKTTIIFGGDNKVNILKVNNVDNQNKEIGRAHV